MGEYEIQVLDSYGRWKTDVLGGILVEWMLDGEV